MIAQFIMRQDHANFFFLMAALAPVTDEWPDHVPVTKAEVIDQDSQCRQGW